jgi:hypothetical protein
MKPIFFKLWNAGLFNQVLSLELAAGLAHETKKPIIVHFFCHDPNRKIYISTPSIHFNDQRNNFTDRSFKNNPHLLDLFDVSADLIIVNEKIDSFKQEEFVIDELATKYYYSKEETESPLYNMILEMEAIALHDLTNIIKQHGGTIWAESILGEGSTFCFTIPI